MATVVLSAVGAAIGGSLGGGVAGISSVAIGRLLGATAGQMVDQKVMGQGSEVVESGKIDRFRITGAAEGATISRVFGRMRVAGQVIWATRFLESFTTSGGGKGGPSRPKTREYSYSVSLAIALCEGEILRVGRVWADGVEVAPDTLNMRVYTGSQTQQPDPKIEAVEGSGAAPAYRGTTYVVFEDLELEPFGNRLPQFNFEVVRATPKKLPSASSDYAHSVKAVALMPGSGEYALATTPVHYTRGAGEFSSANENTPSGKSDFATAMEMLDQELPACRSTSLIVSWFGDDLRAGMCKLRPKVEQKEADGRKMPWRVAGLSRAQAQEITTLAGRPVYGGTPTDQSVVEAISHLRSLGKAVTFYPFILMEQLAENGLADPWSDQTDQPVLPWRGRITLSRAPGRAGSPDGTALADVEVASFFGTAHASDFDIGNGVVSYHGPDEWSYRRFILHNAALCVAAGGVHAFCIGSEMRGLTQVRGGNGFPAVEALRDLAAEVRQLLGDGTKLGYAADWSEYFGYHPNDGSGDVYFHLDPLWADENIDFIGVDNYMPLSDWRDGRDHLDAANWDSLYDLDYLKANIEGGEGYEWYYPSQEARDAQRRSPITDGAHSEPWVFRYKDLRAWWSNAHFDRRQGVRAQAPTAWVPKSKPIWFTELGCAAVEKGTNQPNKFLDSKSSESSLPYYSNGVRDDLIQQLYLQAMAEHWAEPANNPVSEEYGGHMVDIDNMYVWAWDGRPFPAFPNNQELWSDGGNYHKGHWISGRNANRTLASVVEEICVSAGLKNYDVSALYGTVRGYQIDDISEARADLQPLMLRFGFDAVEREGTLRFVMRREEGATDVQTLEVVETSEIKGGIESQRTSHVEISGRVRLGFPQAEADFETVSEEAILPDEPTTAVSKSEMALAMTRGEGRMTVERWLAEARSGQETVRFSVPPSMSGLGAGDLVRLSGKADNEALYRVDRVELGTSRLMEVVRVNPSVHDVVEIADLAPRTSGFVAPLPVHSLFLDLPLLSGDEVPHAPHLAVTGRPWPGSVAVYDAPEGQDYRLNSLISGAAVVGTTKTPLHRTRAGLLDKGPSLEVALLSGALASIGDGAFLRGGNLAAIGDGDTGSWEVFQFQNAELIGQDRYWLSNRLRGQLGTDALMPDFWPANSWFVLLDPRVVQIELAGSSRNLARHFRIGPALRGVDDPSYTEQVHAFSGVGLRPLSPVHLRTTMRENGDLHVTWVRRSRIDADSWDLEDIPLGEERELYQIQVFSGNTLLRQASTSLPTWVYVAEHLVQDRQAGDLRVEVAQVSARFGAGLSGALALA